MIISHFTFVQVLNKFIYFSFQTQRQSSSFPTTNKQFLATILHQNQNQNRKNKNKTTNFKHNFYRKTPNYHPNQLKNKETKTLTHELKTLSVLRIDPSIKSFPFLSLMSWNNIVFYQVLKHF